MTNFNLALVHGFWLSQRDKNAPVEQSLLGKIGVQVLAKLYKEGKIKNLILLTGKLWGDDYPAVSEIAKKDLINLGVPAKSIAVFLNNFDTVSELKTLKEHLKNNQNAAEICTTNAHKISIIKLRRILNITQIPIYSCEEISPELFRQRKFIHCLNHKIYEFARRLLLDIGFNPEKFGKMAIKKSLGPSKNFIFPTDEYYLPK